MGAENWIKFTSREESDRAKAYLSGVNELVLSEDDVWFTSEPVITVTGAYSSSSTNFVSSDHRNYLQVLRKR